MINPAHFGKTIFRFSDFTVAKTFAYRCRFIWHILYSQSDKKYWVVIAREANELLENGDFELVK